MFFYIVLFCLFILLRFVFCILGINKHRSDGLLMLFWGMTIFCLYFLKDEMVGADYIGYLSFFDSCYIVDYENIFVGNLDGFEKGYVLLNKVVYDISPTHTAFNFVLAAFFSLSLAFLLKRYITPIWMGIFLIFSLGIYTNSFSMVRQSMAMMICWFSIKYILERKLIQYILIITVAFLFHKTAIIFFPLYFISSLRLNPFIILVVLSMSVSISYYVHGIMSYLTTLLSANNYLYDTSSGGIVKLMFILFSFVVVYIFLPDKENNRSNFFLNMLFVMLNIQIIALQFSILTRLTDYFIFSLCVLYPLVVSSPYWGRLRPLVRILFIALFILFFCLTHESNLLKTIPYKIAI